MKKWSNLGISFGATILTLLAIEIVLRVQGFDPFADLRDGRALLLRPSQNAEIQYELTPGAQGQAWHTDVVINPDGFRGPQVGEHKGARYRIEVLGDSIAFGNLLPAGAEFPRQLEALLQRANDPAEVINLAVGGYDVLQEAALFEEKGLRYEPDLVVLAYCLNDAGIASPNLEYLYRLNKYSRAGLAHLRLSQFVVSQLDRVRMADYLEQQNDPAVFRQTYRGRIDPIGADESELHALMQEAAGKPVPTSWYADAARVGRIRYAFRRLRAAAERAHTKVVVMVIPWLEERPDNYPHEVAHQIVAREAVRAGFPVLDLTAELLQHGGESLRVKRTDLCHPNQEGHRIIARRLFAYVRATRLDNGGSAVSSRRMPGAAGQFGAAENGDNTDAPKPDGSEVE